MTAMKSSIRGITLIELMVVLIVLAVLASIAYPSYVDQVRRSRRADAITGLTELANLQERHYTQTFTYATTAGALNHSGKSPDEYYVVSVAASATTTYTLTANAAVGSPQQKDTGCTSMSLTNTGAKTPATCWQR